MSHPTDSEAWQALDYFYPNFARDPSSVQLGLSTDGFQHYYIDSSPSLDDQFLSCTTICLTTNV
jgi:hypothetical protein